MAHVAKARRNFNPATAMLNLFQHPPINTSRYTGGGVDPETSSG
jgi:hypothetical protein